MNERSETFLRFMPRCPVCGEFIPPALKGATEPSRKVVSIAVRDSLGVAAREKDYHTRCAPSIDGQRPKGGRLYVVQAYQLSKAAP